MTLLEHYVAAVRMYLPKEAPRDDIANELAGHLQELIDEREEELGRRLTEREQDSVLSGYGSPTLVASRYGDINRGLAFGRQLIGPPLFPWYRRVLQVQLPLTAVVVLIIGATNEPRLLSVSGVLVPLLINFVLTTVVFTSIDALERHRCAGRAAAHAVWSWPMVHLRPIPRWQSVAGLVTLSLGGLWWAAIPSVPRLVLGATSDRVQLTPGWTDFYWPVLVPLLVGVAQRAATLARPDCVWLQLVTRTLINGTALALIYPMLQHYPFVVARHASDVEAVAMATRLSDALWWHLLASGGIYWAICFGYNAWFA